MLKYSVILIYLLIPIFYLGCSSKSKTFNYLNRDKLELGVTTYELATEYFGRPNDSSGAINGEGVFQGFQYIFANQKHSDTSINMIDLEFRNGLLNGYWFKSNYSEDKKKFTTDQLKMIGIDSSNKDHVLRILGKPHGIMLCPSAWFSTYCEKCKEVWIWNSVENDKRRRKFKHMVIFFNNNDVVMKIGFDL